MNRNQSATLKEKFVLIAAAACVLAGCASQQETWPTEPQMSSSGTRHLFVFFDGTGNKKESQTNVRELFDRVREMNNPAIRAIYLPGVGTANMPVTGSAFGLGMERRILKAHVFLAEQYRPGDRIYIFGFSRGAHQARALAGFISYAGLQVVTDENRDRLRKVSNQMIERTKSVKDENMAAHWQAWEPQARAPLQFDEPEFRQATVAPEIAFLGLWDTVPGSSFKDLNNACRFPDTEERQRYKSDPYPPIRFIAHALSRDEKRHKFKPMLVCTGKDARSWTRRTRVEQRWFPGAHSDVGGGYGNPNGLPALSMNWMVGLFNADPQSPQLPSVDGDPYKAPAHWSVGFFPGNVGSKCEDRKAPDGESIEDDVSVKKREDESVVSIVVSTSLSRKEVQNRKYPIDCEGESRAIPKPH